MLRDGSPMPRTTHILTTCCSCHLSQVSHRVVSSELCHIELPVALCSCHLCHHTVTLLTAVEPWGVCLGLGLIFNLICVSVVCVCITCVLLFCRLRDRVTFSSSVLLSIKCVSVTSVTCLRIWVGELQLQSPYPSLLIP